MAFSNNILEQSKLRFTLQPEEELQELQFTKFWMERATDAVFWVAKDARFLYANDVACALVGYSREELLSMTMYDLDPDFSTKVWSEYWRTIKQQGSLYFESLYRTESGWSNPVEINVTYMEYEGREYGCIFVRDITKRKQAEVEIRQALEQEKEIGELKTRFASMVSHEFRNPLHIISFSTSLLRRYSHQWTEEKKQPYLDRIQTAVEHLSQLMDEILIIGRAEAGKLKFSPRALDLEQFCCDLVAQLQQSHSRHHTFTFDKRRGDCSTACVDEKLLQPILTNLLENAIKYSPLGSTVNLALSCWDGEVIFQIKDRGIGIPAADRQRLFEPFYRGKNVGDIPGTGLGLAVVKKLVDIHGGQITVASEVGVGTTFTIALPLG